MESKFFTDTVTIQTPTIAVGTTGERVKTYADSFTVTGSFQKTTGKYSIADGILADRDTYGFMANSFSVDYGDRVSYNNKTYRIVNIVRSYRHIELELELIDNGN